MKEWRSQQLRIIGRIEIVPAAAKLHSVTNNGAKSRRFLSIYRKATLSYQLLHRICNSEGEKMHVN